MAIGELTDGLDICLDAVPKKYEGLDGTELAISESQERMAVVVAAKDVEKFMAYATEENLEATVVATVTDTSRLVMKWRNKDVVDLSRRFLNRQTVSCSTVRLSYKTERGRFLCGTCRNGCQGYMVKHHGLIGM